ncbi:CGNR zinc finger domain-containing protein [Pinirhizobacter sp.]|jgi:predicted RNA-binding Zn ribbon-like protein|uniref:CGNR zinc finger domain-containing protein n=1 Tax=Pinirhizobacter sp. TaxID=2950432 RepID=UPI002F3FC7E2
MNQANPPALFIADSLGLDFLNSIAIPVDTTVEFIGDGGSLLSWLDQAHLVPKEVLEQFSATAAPGELDAVATHARAFREWFRGFVVQHMGKPLSDDAVGALDPLNRILARDEGYGQIVARQDGTSSGVATGLAFESRRRWRSSDTLLIPIARSIADLLTTENFSDVKPCQGHACTLLFVDHTRGRARRWCSMAVCGNRAKQAAHRERAGKAAASAKRRA